jgi:protein-disulfide isomerase
MNRPNLKWVLGWLSLAALVLVLWNPLRSPFIEGSLPSGPPWIYGKADARFTFTLYADLECPYCQGYLPQLQQWIDRTPEVSLQWQHLPLPMHDPAATQQARLVECAGEVGGAVEFWSAVTWIYQNTRSNSQGVPPELTFPDHSTTLQTCLDSDRPDAVIQAQKAEAASSGLTATPSLQLVDNHTSKNLVLLGPISGDALLSALDLLATPDTTEMPADLVSDMPR